MSIIPAVRVSHLADAADSLGYGHAAGSGAGTGGLVWLGKPGATAIGKAFTIQQRIIEPARAAQARAVRHGDVVKSLAAPGDLIVIDVEGETAGATWGEAHTLRCINRGVAGVLIYGLTRDIAALRERGFPLLCRGGTPFRSTGRIETVDIQCEVEIMGVRIRHGDTVAVDADGFICLSPDTADAVLERARKIALSEQERDQKLLDARSAGKPTSNG